MHKIKFRWEWTSLREVSLGIDLSVRKSLPFSTDFLAFDSVAFDVALALVGKATCFI